MGTLFYPKIIKPKNPALLFIHGWTSNETGYKPRAEALTKLGFICLTFNLRGHDGDQKDLNLYSRENHKEDVLAAYDFLVSQKNVDRKKIGVVGASYGGYLASIISSERSIRWLVLRAPALYYNENFDTPTSKLIDTREADFFQKMQPEKNNFALLEIQRFLGKLLIVESEKDQIIPHKIIEYYKDAVKDKTQVSYEIINNANHQLSTLESKQKFIDILGRWFKNNLSS